MAGRQPQEGAAVGVAEEVGRKSRVSTSGELSLMLLLQLPLHCCNQLTR